MSEKTATRRKRKILRFEGICPRCDGSGDWNGRKGYPCRGCNATGKIEVEARAYLDSFNFRIVSPKGNVTKQRYDAKAELTHELPRFTCGSTIGGGWYEHHTRTDPIGAACGVYGVGATGELIVALPGGGFGATGTRKMQKSGTEVTTAVRVLEPAAAEAIEKLRELVAERAADDG